MSPFDKARHARLLKGLEVSEVNLSYAKSNNDIFRIDSGYFQKTFLDEEAAIRKRGGQRLSTLGAQIRSFGAYSLNNSVDYLDSGVPFIRGVNMKGGRVNFDNMQYISKEAHALLWKSEVKAGTVLLSMSGTIGDVALATAAWPYPANSNQDIAKINTKGTINPYSLYAFLLSRFGQHFLQREARGSVQQHVFLSQIEQLEFPAFTPKFDAAIQRTIELSEHQHVDASRLTQSAESTLLRALNLENWQAPAPLSYIRSSRDAFTAGRLDAEHFHEKFYAAKNAVLAAGAQRFIPLTELLVSLTNGHTPLRHDLSVGDVPFLCAEHVTDYNLSYDSEKRILLEHHETELARTQVRDGDVLLTIKGRVGNAAIAENVPEHVNINQDVALLRFNDTLPHWYIVAYINSRFGKLQSEKMSTGAINPFLGLFSIKQFEIPLLDKKAMANIAARTKQHVTAARLAKQRAEQLLDAAKRAVEIAIEQSEAAALAYLAKVNP